MSTGTISDSTIKIWMEIVHIYNHTQKATKEKGEPIRQKEKKKRKNR
jgi:hypothetical protein